MMKALMFWVAVFALGFLAGCATLTGVVDDAEDVITHARTHVQ